MISKEQIDETLGHFSAEDWLVLQNEVSNLEGASLEEMHGAGRPSASQEKARQKQFQ